MNGVWTEQLTWKSGLLTMFYPTRGQRIKVLDRTVEIHVFEMRGKTENFSLNDMIPYVIVNHENPTIKLPRFSQLKLVCIVVRTGFSAWEFDCGFVSNDGVEGAMRVIVNFRVTNAHSVIHEYDVVSQLVIYCQKLVRDLGQRYDHKFIKPSIFENELSSATVSHLGLAIKNVTLVGDLNWPEEITKNAANIRNVITDTEFTNTRNDLDNTTQIRKLQLIKDKLAQFGITQPALVAAALGAHDEDIKEVLLALERLNNAEKDHRGQSQKILEEFIRVGLVPRPLLDPFIETVIEEVTTDRVERPNVIGYLAENGQPQTTPQLFSPKRQEPLKPNTELRDTVTNPEKGPVFRPRSQPSIDAADDQTS